MKIPKYFYFRVRVINKGTGVEVEDASDVDVVEVVRCKDCKECEERHTANYLPFCTANYTSTVFRIMPFVVGEKGEKMAIKDRQEEKRICEDIIRALDKPRRLIDADKLKADFIGKRYGTQAIEYVIDQQPTVDAEPVVRCKDCKHYIADGCDECQLMIAKSIIASINNKRWDSDFYCAFGERREDETVHG